MAETSNLEPVVGDVIDNKYSIDSLMGEGGMGKVFRVKHTQLGKTFALKLMHLDRMEMDPTLVAKFKREAKTLATIDHPNVVMITDYGVSADRYPYIVMEYIEGITLRTYLNQYGKLEEHEAMLIAKQICSGLHEAHKKGIVHRDMKPENIMLRRLDEGDLIVRVLDFGIAKVVTSKREAYSDSKTMIENFDDDAVAGTIKYMAYEQVMNEEVDARTDVYAICVIIYEMLTGVVPTLFKSQVEKLGSLRPDVSKELVEIVHKGLQESKEARQQSALELRQELESLEQQVLITALNRSTAGLNIAGQITNSNIVHTTSSGYSTGERTDGSNDGTLGSLIESKPKKSSRALLAVLTMLVLMAAATVALVPQIRNRILGTGNATNELPAAALPTMVKITGGPLKMGKNNSIDEYARPEHAVVVDTFEVSKFLITNRQYAEFIKATNRPVPKHWPGKQPPTEILEKPVVYVSCVDALAYCQWLSEKTGRAYRLLTEAEWEFLARTSAKLEVEELMQNVEWTGTEFSLYPDSKSKMPPIDQPVRVRIFRGKNDDSAAEPETFRLFHYETSAFPDLGFRVASTPAK